MHQTLSHHFTSCQASGTTRHKGALAWLAGAHRSQYEISIIITQCNGCHVSYSSSYVWYVIKHLVTLKTPNSCLYSVGFLRLCHWRREKDVRKLQPVWIWRFIWEWNIFHFWNTLIIYVYLLLFESHLKPIFSLLLLKGKTISFQLIELNPSGCNTRETLVRGNKY